MITTTLVPYDELSFATLYDILSLRSAVFIVEQGCVYQDLDYKDQTAMHLLMREHDRLIAYARILPYDEDYMSFGRLVTDLSHRGQGLGQQLMDLILHYLSENYPSYPIKITAQHYLHDFYQAYGFNAEGGPFEMEGRPHVIMVKHP